MTLLNDAIARAHEQSFAPTLDEHLLHVGGAQHRLVTGVFVDDATAARADAARELLSLLAAIYIWPRVPAASTEKERWLDNVDSREAFGAWRGEVDERLEAHRASCPDPRGLGLALITLTSKCHGYFGVELTQARVAFMDTHAAARADENFLDALARYATEAAVLVIRLIEEGDPTLSEDTLESTQGHLAATKIPDEMRVAP